MPDWTWMPSAPIAVTFIQKPSDSGTYRCRERTESPTAGRHPAPPG